MSKTMNRDLNDFLVRLAGAVGVTLIPVVMVGLLTMPAQPSRDADVLAHNSVQADVHMT